MSWPDVTYEKILERLDAEPVELKRLARVKWVVTEKIHGAHFALVSDGKELRCAKRKGYLAAGESFFGHETVVEEVRQNVASLWKALGAPYVLVAGELFGEGVQTGIWYSPRTRFFAYDVWAGEYLDFDVARAACERAGVPFVEPLHIGSYDEAMQFQLGFDSRVPARLGLTPPPKNLAEGIVIRPLKEVRINGARALLKRKIAEFAEDERYHGARAYLAPKAGRADGSRARKWRPAPSALGELLERASARVNPPRLQSAISKVGPDSPDEIVRTATDDILSELGPMTASDRELLRVQLAAQLEALLRSG